MTDTKDITFQDTIDWATLEEERRGDRSEGIPIVYLVVGAVIIFVLVFLILYLMGSNPEEDISALDMMKDDNYVFDNNNYDQTYDEPIDNLVDDPVDNYDQVNDHIDETGYDDPVDNYDDQTYDNETGYDPVDIIDETE